MWPGTSPTYKGLRRGVFIAIIVRVRFRAALWRVRLRIQCVIGSIPACALCSSPPPRLAHCARSFLNRTLRIIAIPRQQLFHERAIFTAKNFGVIARRSAVLRRHKAVIAQRQHAAGRNRYDRQRLIGNIRFFVACHPPSYRQMLMALS